MNTYTHRQGLFTLPAALALPSIIVSDAINWNDNFKQFKGRRHYVNWLCFLAEKYGQDEDDFLLQVQTAVDNGFFTLTPVGGDDPHAFLLSRSLPGGDGQ